MMNHADIEEHDIRARYVGGRLTAEEEQEFEGHLVDCPRCIDAVECEIGLRDGVRLVAPEWTPRPPTRSIPLAIWNAAPLTRLLQAAAALLLVASIGMGLWLFRSSGDLRSARVERDELQRRAGQAEQSAAALEARLADLARRATEAPAASVPGSIESAAVFALGTVRGSADAAAAPVNRITIDRNTRLVVFSLDLPGPAGSGDYTVSLRDGAGGLLWSGGTFPPSSPDSLGVAVDAKLLPTGDYVLELQLRSAAGTLTPLSRYPFRVSR